MHAPNRTFRLSPEQVKQFHDQGFLAPLTACTPEEMKYFREHAEFLVKRDAGGVGGYHNLHNRHLDDRVIFELSTLPGIVGPMQSVLGEDLLLWRTNFFNKEPGGKEIPWHQDRNYWPLEPEVVISAWLAIDRADVENSCVQVVPGTHRQIIKHVKSTEGMGFDEMAETSGVDLSKKVDVILEPGQFLLFNERTLHHSEPNRSNRRRMGLAIRVILPQVRVLKWDSDAHRVMLFSGEDRMGFNEHCQPPVAATV
jgi:hypothetical protein